MMKLIRNLKDNLPSFTWRKDAPLIGIFLIVAVAFQWLEGAYQSEFGGHPDEPAHYVTGLFVRDALATLPTCLAERSVAPLARFASKDAPGSFYDHYPKVALGNWPPVFYVMQSAWTLLFSPQRGSLLLLMAVLGALTAWLLFRALQREFGPPVAGFGALLFLALPLVREHTGMLMTEIPVTLFTFAAMLFLVRFLEREETLDSLMFGLLASLAILTKGSGLFLALVVPLAVALTRKFHLLKRASFWYAAVIVAVLCGPWTWKFREVARAGWMEDNPSWHFTQQALFYYPKKLVLAVGFLLTILALLGLMSRLFRSQQGRPVSSLWATVGALLASVLCFHCVVPAGLEPRHLVPALPALVMFIFAGAQELLVRLERRRLSPQLAGGVVYGMMTLALVGETVRPALGGYDGLGPVAAKLLADPANAKAVFLISSDATGEGIFIAEVAMRERRPGHIVRRASKVLGSSSWSGAGYKAKFEGSEELMAALQKDGIAIIVTDDSLPPARRVRHHGQLREALDTHPDKFTLLGKYPMIRGGVRHEEALRVYRRQ